MALIDNNLTTEQVVLEIEHHLYRTDDGMFKRFFDKEDIKTIFSDFDVFFCEEQKMMRYKREKIVYCLALLNEK